MQDIAAVKLGSHEKINEYMEHQEWRRKINYGGSWRWHTFRHPITPTTIGNCHTAHDNLKTIPQGYKLITSYDCGYLYLKDLDDAVDFLKSPGISVDQVKQVIVDRPKNSIVIKSAKHDFRTYFKNQRVETDQKTSLINFLKNRTDIRLSPSMKEWITKYDSYRYMCDNYFIDHNNDGFLTMLTLVSPIKIKKTVTLLTE